MKPRILGLGASLACVALTIRAATETSGVPFRQLGFDAACAAAKAEGKIVFVDFFTTWCAPCKELDRTTWREPSVAKLLGERTVPLKIDAEKERALSERYKIEVYPTLLLVQADGTELDRLVGFLDAPKFIADFTAGLGGKPTLVRAHEAVAAAAKKSDHDEVQARYNLARQLAQSGKNEEALAEFLWCYDVGMVKEASFVGVRTIFLASVIEQLGRKYPPALAALIARRDAAQYRLLAEKSDRAAATDFVALNRTLNDDARTLAVYDLLPVGDGRRAAFGETAFKLLLAGRRYADAVEAMPYSNMMRRYDSYVLLSIRSASDTIKDANRRIVSDTTAESIEALAGAGDLVHARELIAKLQTFLGSPEKTRSALIARLVNAGHPELIETSVKPR